MNSELITEGISVKTFLSIFIAFIVLSVAIMGFGYSSPMFPVMFFIITIPVLFAAFYLRGINGGLSKAYMVTPIIIALLICIAIVFFGQYLLGSGYPGALFIIAMMANPLVWLFGLFAALIAVVFFLKVTFAKPRVELPQAIKQ